MEPNTYANLNGIKVRTALADLIWDITDVDTKSKNVRYDNKRHMLVVHGHDILCYDRQYNWPKKVQHIAAVYEFLKSVDELLTSHSSRYRRAFKKASKR